MRHLCAAALLAATLATPAQAELVIEGRSAQALHCAAMLFIVSTELFDLGEISRNARDNAQRAALVIEGLALKPGSRECDVVKDQLLKVAPDYVELGKRFSK